MGKFSFTPGRIEGLVIVEPARWDDARGYFMESYSRRDYAAAGIGYEFVQDNQSLSRRGVLRGLHYQRTRPQGKLVRVVHGSVLDVAVDLQRSSPTFGQWQSVLLSADNRRQFWIPAGFAHGFLALEDDSVLAYKCTEYYMPELDAGIAWNDPQVAIDWDLEKVGLGIDKLIISDKDRALPTVGRAVQTDFEW
ncbi:MAG: dTDP-4-dehydrorhamnose 3,5-epimerase [Rikenellaceae bacterium]|jgi:dTDP-4-dehydrorhamnose 3,5-epimerase|nr:dTDP-4-dehydrorhamnose 3,5-epimerase [Rikenellaceae bacterium]